MNSGIGQHQDHSAEGEVISLPEDSPQLGRALLHALRNAGIAVLYQDRELKTVWARNMRAPWFAGDADDPQSGLPAAQAERLMASRRNVIATGNPERLEISVPGEEGMRWFEIWVDADFAADGAVQGIVTTKVETTEQRRREQTLRALLREVSHRSKNLLAIIQSIASQTGRYSDTITDFLARFRGRLQSLASSQDLVTSSNWRGAALRELVAGQVRRYGSDPAHNLRFEGSNPFLNPNAALHIGLALHELAVNSVSYGALSRPEGFVQVSATLASDDAEDPSLLLVWSERITTDAQRKNGKKRFGSVALERVVPTSLNGTAVLDITDGRLEYRLVVPHGNFETD
jgi:two-component sensor histidine kinase